MITEIITSMKTKSDENKDDLLRKIEMVSNSSLSSKTDIEKMNELMKNIKTDLNVM